MNVCCSLIFSYWTSTLDALAGMLTQQNIRLVQVDGRVDYAERSTRLKAFQEDPGVAVLLMSIGTGAVGYAYMFQFWIIKFVRLRFTADNDTLQVEPHSCKPGTRHRASMESIRRRPGHCASPANRTDSRSHDRPLHDGAFSGRGSFPNPVPCHPV